MPDLYLEMMLQRRRGHLAGSYELLKVLEEGNQVNSRNRAREPGQNHRDYSNQENLRGLGRSQTGEPPVVLKIELALLMRFLFSANFLF